MLDWLWKDDERWSYVLWNENLVFDSLCHILVTEGHQRYIVELLKLDEPAHVQLHPAWRGLLLRNLLSAQYNSTIGLSADPMLKTFFEIREEVLQARRKIDSRKGSHDSYGLTSLWPVTLESSGVLASGTWPETTRSDYLAFVDIFCEVARTKGVDVEWARARMMLHVPEAPEPQPIIGLLKDAFEGLDDRAARTKLFDSVLARAAIYFTCRRLEELLRTTEPDVAQWARHWPTRLFAEKDLARFRWVWRGMLRSMGVKDPGYDLEALMTWAPDCYWRKHRKEEHRLHSSAD